MRDTKPGRWAVRFVRVLHVGAAAIVTTAIVGVAAPSAVHAKPGVSPVVSYTTSEVTWT